MRMHRALRLGVKLKVGAGTHLVRAIRTFVGPCRVNQGGIVAIAGASKAFCRTCGCLACSCQAINAWGAGDTIAAVGSNSTSFCNQLPISVKAGDVPWVLCQAARGRAFRCHARCSDVHWTGGACSGLVNTALIGALCTGQGLTVLQGKHAEKTDDEPSMAWTLFPSVDAGV